MLSPTTANYNFTLQTNQSNLLALLNSEALNNLFNRNASHHPNMAHQPASHKPYQSSSPYYDYQKSNKKGIYQITNEDTDPYLEGFYTTLKQENEEVQYSDKRFDEVDTNFIGVEFSCRKCGTPFFLRF